jgi:enterochelin esterase family protein
MKGWIMAASCVLLASAAHAQQGDALTPKALQAALATRPGGADAEKLADRVRGYFGRENLKKGPNPKIDETTVAWALEVPEAAAAPHVVSADGKFDLPLTRLGSTPVYAAVASLPDKAGFPWKYRVDGKDLGGGPLEVYRIHPDNLVQPGVPKGTVKQMPEWHSKIFAGTKRDWWIYVPAQYKPDTPACVMIFQDGGGAKNYVPTVFDNLIHKGDMPVTVGIFINPGKFDNGRSNRSFEYDTLSDQYVRFLMEEILPEAEKDLKLRHDAASRAVAGSSSGGICAFTAAWERPNEFSKVLSWVGSFTNLQPGASGHEGGHNYPAIIRRADKKPLRIFLQDGENDVNNIAGNWPLANQYMANSLAFKGYDYKFEFGHGFHSGKHGQAILPDSLRWLWRDYKPGP